MLIEWVLGGNEMRKQKNWIKEKEGRTKNKLLIKSALNFLSKVRTMKMKSLLLISLKHGPWKNIKEKKKIIIKWYQTLISFFILFLLFCHLFLGFGGGGLNFSQQQPAAAMPAAANSAVQQQLLLALASRWEDFWWMIGLLVGDWLIELSVLLKVLI